MTHWRRWRWAFFSFLGILLLSSIPPSGIPQSGVVGLDKGVHVGIYAIFGWCLEKSGGRLIPLWCLGVALAAFDEGYQHTVSGRSAELGDWVADGLGLALGLGLGKLWARHEKTR